MKSKLKELMDRLKKVSFVLHLKVEKKILEDSLRKVKKLMSENNQLEIITLQCIKHVQWQLNKEMDFSPYPLSKSTVLSHLIEY